MDMTDVISLELLNKISAPDLTVEKALNEKWEELYWSIKDQRGNEVYYATCPPKALSFVLGYWCALLGINTGRVDIKDDLFAATHIRKNLKIWRELEKRFGMEPDEPCEYGKR